MINPTWLDTFITLVETGNFTRTAEQRFMTQPGVSQHLKKLEEACQCELVIRLGKGIQLTEQGQRVYHYAKEQQEKEQDFDLTGDYGNVALLLLLFPGGKRWFSWTASAGGPGGAAAPLCN